MAKQMEKEKDVHPGNECLIECSVCLSEKECINTEDEGLMGQNVLSYVVQHLDMELELKTVCHRCWNMLNEFHEFYEMIKKQHHIRYSLVMEMVEPKLEACFRAPEPERPFSMEFVEIKDEPLEPMKEEEIIEEGATADRFSVLAADAYTTDGGEFGVTGSIVVPEEADQTVNTRMIRSTEISSSQTSVRMNVKTKVLKEPKFDNEILEFYKRLVCEICDPQKIVTCEPPVEYTNLKDLNRHMRKAHDQEMANVKCPKCDKKLRSRVKLLEHKEMHLNPDRFRCNECNEIYQNVEEHMRNRHQERTNCCEDCGKRFPTKSRLTAHIRKMHSVKDIVCDQCQKPFSKYTIKDHIRSVHESSFICEHCPRVFKTRLPLEKHLEEHKTGVRPAATVTCNICGTVVRDKYCLATHMKRLHTKHAPVKCGSCGKEFKSKHNLDAHLANVCTDRSFPCTICGKQFKKKIKLKEHMTTHTKSALYQCQYCPKTFSFETQLYTHRKQIHYEQWLELQRRRKEGERFKAKRIGD